VTKSIGTNAFLIISEKKEIKALSGDQPQNAIISQATTVRGDAKK
jgi:hypothetical protein